jgi:hypothetical protein
MAFLLPRVSATRSAGAADGTEVEDAARVLRELYSVEGGALDGAFYLVDGSVEAALVYLEG